ncbi:MAG: zf-TFIIB domain-containing protein [Candidatus Goldiibacteriota bacterium]
MMEKTDQKQCRHCSSFIPRAAAVCSFCRQSQDPAAAADLSRFSKCPVCKIPIYPAHINGHFVLHCEECEGTAVPKEALMKLQAMETKRIERSPVSGEHIKPPYFEPRSKPPFLICPLCGKKMEEQKFGPLSADKCSKCGSLWLESGKEKHLNEILGPYKSRMLNKSKDTGRRRR